MIQSTRVSEAIYRLIDQLIKQTSLSLIEHGFSLYMERAVSSISMEDEIPNKIYAQVRDDKLYAVSLNIQTLTNSVCSCARPGNCSHLAAVFFATYALQGFRPEFLLKKAIKFDETVKPAQVETMKLKSELRTPTKKTAPLDLSDNDVEVWQLFFQEHCQNFRNENGFNFMNALEQIILQFTPYCKSWSQPKQLLYMLHVYLFTLQKLDQISKQPLPQTFSYYAFGYSFGIKDSINEGYAKINQHLAVMGDSSEVISHSHLLEQTAHHLFEITFTAIETSIDWMYLYRGVWSTVVTDQALRKLELDRVIHFSQTATLLPRQKDYCQIAKAHLLTLEGNYLEAMGCLDQVNEAYSKLHLAYPYLNELAEQADKSNLLPWLYWLKPHMMQARHNELENYLNYWTLLESGYITQEQLESTIYEFHPRSFSFYTDHLLVNENYEKLVDLYLVHHMPPSEIPAEIRRKIESTNGQLLLPLYHQAVADWVGEKNRESYRYAVRAMKKIYQLYKKQKKLDRWEQYLAWMTSHYSRLRAFQEEIQKGIKQE
mgnify:CR=1 FL=1